MPVSGIRDGGMDTLRLQARLAVRLIGFFFVLLGLWMLVSNLVESWGKVSLVFWLSYLQAQILRPLLAVVLGFLTMALAGPLGRLLAGRP
jgi:hypothetical protein